MDESRFVEAGIFRRSTCQALLDEHVNGAVDHNYRLWLLFNLEVFWRHFIDGDSVLAVESWIEDSRRLTPV